MVEIRFVDFYKWAVAKKVHGNDRLVADVIYYHSFVHGDCWLSKARIADHTGLSLKSIQRSISSLEGRNLVLTNRGNGRSAIEFKLNIKVDSQSIDMDSQSIEVVTESIPMVTQSIATKNNPEKPLLWTHSPYPMDSQSIPMDSVTPQRNIQEQESSYQSSVVDSRAREIPTSESRPPLDQWVLSEMSRFGYDVPVPVAANIATRTLGAMSRDYAEEYITDRLSELTGQPQKKVVRYILQDGPGWLERKLNPAPARKERNTKRQRERVVDPSVRKYEHPPEVIRAFELQMGLIKDDDA